MGDAELIWHLLIQRELLIQQNHMVLFSPVLCCLFISPSPAPHLFLSAYIFILFFSHVFSFWFIQGCQNSSFFPDLLPIVLLNTLCTDIFVCASKHIFRLELNKRLFIGGMVADDIYSTGKAEIVYVECF